MDQHKWQRWYRNTVWMRINPVQEDGKDQTRGSIYSTTHQRDNAAILDGLSHARLSFLVYFRVYCPHKCCCDVDITPAFVVHSISTWKINHLSMVVFFFFFFFFFFFLFLFLFYLFDTDSELRNIEKHLLIGYYWSYILVHGKENAESRPRSCWSDSADNLIRATLNPWIHIETDYRDIW